MEFLKLKIYIRFMGRRIKSLRLMESLLPSRRENLPRSSALPDLASPRCFTSSREWMCPQSGKVYLNGQDVYAQNNEKLAIFRRRQVGLIYQFHNLIPTLNVVENMTLPILMDKRKVNKERLKDLLNLLGLEERKNHLPNQLSGGQQQRSPSGGP